MHNPRALQYAISTEDRNLGVFSNIGLFGGFKFGLELPFGDYGRENVYAVGGLV